MIKKKKNKKNVLLTLKNNNNYQGEHLRVSKSIGCPRMSERKLTFDSSYNSHTDYITLREEQKDLKNCYTDRKIS